MLIVKRIKVFIIFMYGYLQEVGRPNSLIQLNNLDLLPPVINIMKKLQQMAN